MRVLGLRQPVAAARPRFRAQRVFDVVIVLTLTPIALAFAAVTAAAIFLDSPGPVLYRCTRVGLHGRTFSMLKFRKFHRHAEGVALTTDGDDRFTPIGRFLAVTKLDELPQLINVLRGEMRLVGPRPEAPEFVAAFPDQYAEILQVLPGITGPAALAFSNESHLLGEQEDPMTFYQSQLLPAKIDIDVAYARQHRLRSDAAILLHTGLVPARQLLRRARMNRVKRHADAGAQPINAKHAWMLGLSAAAVLLTFLITSSTPL
jgi:lipopolysaccharide/colanic/teichoic acid biosynthesis glycosyltransferase